MNSRLHRLTLTAAATAAFTSFTSNAADPAGSARQGSAAATNVRSSDELLPKSVVDLLTRRVVGGDGQDSALFAPHSWYVPPPAPPPEPPAKPTPPKAPPLPYTYLGSYVREGDQPLYFLVKQNRIYTVRPGDEIDGIYHVDALENGRLLLTYKPLNVQQTILVDGGTQ
jgi:hypothetical protein